jgi:hypothetical protein
MSIHNAPNEFHSPKTADDWLSDFDKLRLDGELTVEFGEYSNTILANFDPITAGIFNQYKSVFVPQGDLIICLERYQNKNSGDKYVIGASETDRYWFYIKKNDPRVYSYSFDSDWDDVSDIYENIIDLIVDYAS